MSPPVLATKLYVPAPPANAVLRPRLVERIDEGLHRNLTLISAPAGFGKTTLVSAWAAACERKVAWLSLDEGDSDLTRFLLHLVAALQTIAPTVGDAALALLQSPQPPPAESTLTALLNDIASMGDDLVLVLDDYHVIDAKPVDDALTFVLEHLPPKMRLVIVTREDPQLALARLRGRGQLSELRVTDLRFSASEASGFLNESMGLSLSADDVATLESRTEGWIAGLQLAALSLQGHADPRRFIRSFTGSDRFVLDYLLEEVLQRQSTTIQTFLLRTSILERLCGPLCDVVLDDEATMGQAILEYLERANLFVVPLDNERRWYRYHHLFMDLLRQRLRQSTSPGGVNELHLRASQWYEEQGLELEAFQHAAAANDVGRAERLIEGQGVPLQYRGAGASVLKWLDSLPAVVLDARPSLWVTYATALFFSGRHTAVEQKLEAAEAALQGAESNDSARDLVGRIASIRATLAIIRRDAETIIVQSCRALEFLRPDNLAIRTATTYTLGYAYQVKGDRVAARRAYAEVMGISQSAAPWSEAPRRVELAERGERRFGDSIYTIAATLGLGQVLEAENQLVLANQAYQRVLELTGDPPRGLASEAHLGLARIHYEWNDLDAAERHAQQCLQITQQAESVDTFVSHAVFLVRLRLAQGDVRGAAASLDEADAFLRQHNFAFRTRDVAAARVLTLLYQGHVAEAAQLTQTHELPISRARVHLAQGDPDAALLAVEPWRQEVQEKGWADKRLEVMLLQAVALQAHGDRDRAVNALLEALALAEPGGFVRSFVDEGPSMATLLSAVAARGRMTDFIARLLPIVQTAATSDRPAAQPLNDALSEREMDVLRLIAQGLSNHEIGERLFLALDTVKGHNRRIFGKLQVRRRTEAVARARELGLA